jgi:hypothetical protein
VFVGVRMPRTLVTAIREIGFRDGNTALSPTVRRLLRAAVVADGAQTNRGEAA